ncbi:MAG: O-antigen ligase family protein [Bryobacteraceae bacterium]
MLLLSGALILLADRRTIRPHWTCALLAAVALWGAVQLLFGWTIYRYATIEWTLIWLGNLAAYELGRRFAPRDTLFVFACCVAIAGTVQAATAPGAVFWIFESGFEDMVTGPFVYHNQFAAFVEIVFPVALAGCLLESSQRLIHALVAAFLFAAVIASGSRTGALAVTAELLAMVALAARVRGRAIWGPAAAVAVAIVVTVAAVGPDRLLLRFESGLSGGRLDYWQASLPMLRDHWFAGVGLGNWPLAYPRYAFVDDGLVANQAHSEWVEWACEGGLPFVLLLAAIAFRTSRDALASRWGLGVAAFWLHCAVDYPTRRPAIAVFFFAFAGAVSAWRRRE